MAFRSGKTSNSLRWKQAAGNKRYKVRPVNRLFIVGLFAACILFAGITASFSYAARKKSIMLQCDMIMRDVFELYYGKVYHFSDIYTPIYSSDENERIMRSYFARTEEEVPSATERAALVALLERMIRQDEAIAFIGLDNPDAAHNYCLISGGNSLKELWPDIPREEDGGADKMQLLGRYEWQDESGGLNAAFLIKGGAQAETGNGRIIVGYRSDIFDRVTDVDRMEMSAAFLLINDNGVIYDSEGSGYEEGFRMDRIGQEPAYRRDGDGRYWFTGAMENRGRVFTVAYRIPWWRMVVNCGSATGPVLMVLVGFSCFAAALYLYSSGRIFRRVEQIQDGLAVIGDNRLDYRLAVTDVNDEFDEIAGNINIMAERLKESIEKEYEMRVRQVRAELSRIQARFNPHFLYNTLEVVRGNLFRNGDMEDANYIEKLSRIFRSLTDAVPVTSVREEIAFCNLYLTLLQMRYHDAVDISYDIDAGLQECGILAYLIQPAIENYFMHGLCEDTEYHTLEIVCGQAGENIRFTISDNGTGIPEEKLREINSRLCSPEEQIKGYGLSGIAKRIRLFYGEEYGISLERNRPCGTRVVIVIPRMSIEEHRSRLGISGTE